MPDPTPMFPFGQPAAWEPNPAWSAASNLQHFMDRHGIATYAELHRRAAGDVAWFWDAVLQDLGIEFHRPYDQILDLQDGVQFPRWCVGGQMNIVHNCLDKWQATPVRDHVALRWEGEEGATRHIHLRRAGRRGVSLRQRLARPRPGAGRRGRPLHAHDPGAGDRLPGDPQDRRRDPAALQRLRPRRHRQPAGRRRGQGRGDGGRPLPPRAGRPHETGAGRRTGGRAQRAPRARRRAHWPGRHAHDAGPRSLVARAGAGAASHCGDGGHRRRGRAHDHLHQRHHGPAQGRRPHALRLPHQGRAGHAPAHGPEGGGRHVLVHRHGLDDGAMGSLRDAAQRRHDGLLRRRAGLPAPGPALGAGGAPPRDPPGHQPHAHPGAEEPRRRAGAAARPCRACGPSAPPAARGTRRAGCGPFTPCWAGQNPF